jgi:hypothetical protein
MKNTAYRFAFTTGAILLGIIIILFFTFLGKKGSGPLEDFFTEMGTTVTDLEKSILLSNREPIRSKELGWFNSYRVNKKLITNPDTILLGIYDNHYKKSFDHMLALEDSLQLSLPIIQLYTAWGDRPEERFPIKYAKAIDNLGSVPFITWEPWLNDFDRKELGLPYKEDPNKNGFTDIRNGDYNLYIDKWASDVKAFGKTVFIRFGHEMNDPYRYPWGPQNNKPGDFIAAWKYIVERFKAQDVHNVVWVWSPHPAYKMYNEYYPGDDYVDWVGVGALNYGTVALWSKWWSFDEIFGDYYNQLSTFNKPIVITEFGSLAVGGERYMWYEKALSDLPGKYPMLKSILFYNNDNDNTTLNKSLVWSLNSDTLTINAVKRTIHNW